MKRFEKFILLVYSLFMMVFAFVVCLTIFGFIKISDITNVLEYITEDSSWVIALIVTSVICIFCSIKCLFFRAKKEKTKNKSNVSDIMLQNEEGRLLISKNAIENTAKNIIRSKIDNCIESKVNVSMDKSNNLSLYIELLLDDAKNVKETVTNLQGDVKNAIKENMELELKEVNIKIDSKETSEKAEVRV